MRHLTAQAIDKFNKLLNFSEDQYSQDWEHEFPITSLMRTLIGSE